MDAEAGCEMKVVGGWWLVVGEKWEAKKSTPTTNHQPPTTNHYADTGRNCRSRPGRIAARPSAVVAGHRIHSDRNPQPRVCREPRPGRRAGAGHCGHTQRRGRRRADAAAGTRPPRHRAEFSRV